MKGLDIKIGSTYLVKISGREVQATVLRTVAREVTRKATPGSPVPYEAWTGRNWEVRNEVTGRIVRVRSAQRFRQEVLRTPADHEVQA